MRKSLKVLLITATLLTATPFAVAQYPVTDALTHTLLNGLNSKVDTVLNLLRDIRTYVKQIADVIGDPNDTGYVDVTEWTAKLAGFKRIQTGEPVGLMPDQYLAWLKKNFYSPNKFVSQEEQNLLTEKRKQFLNQEQLSAHAIAQYAQSILSDAQQETTRLVNEANKNYTMVRDQKMQTKLRLLDMVKGEVSRQLSISDMRLNGARAIALDPVFSAEGTKP
jgi:hypothetical protein